jgi:DNA-binding MarR family transcriptional regulator
MERFVFKDDANPDEKLLLTIVRLSELYKKDCGLIFGAYGLTFAQYNVLRILEGSVRGQNILSRVSSLMLVSGANMTGIAKRLERDGFIVRKGVPEDERITVLEITPKGKKTLRSIAKGRDALITKYLKVYSQDLRRKLQSTLRKCLHEASSRP